MNETFVTLSGWLGGDVTLRQAGGVPVAHFRVASTPRRYQRKTDSWEDGDTQWYSVNAWRALAQNCDDSLRRGDPVVVHGKLSAHVWTNKSGLEVTTFEVEAAFVGHDLNRGTSEFRRRKLTAAPEPAQDLGPERPEPEQVVAREPEGVTETAA
jgi:single-strand DNA-binding protein